MRPLFLCAANLLFLTGQATAQVPAPPAAGLDEVSQPAAQSQNSLDRIEERLDRLERRLGEQDRPPALDPPADPAPPVAEPLPDATPPATQ